MIIRTSFILLLTVHDVGFAVYVRFYDPDNRTGFMGHLCGALAGLTVGLFLLDNRYSSTFTSFIFLCLPHIKNKTVTKFTQ